MSPGLVCLDKVQSTRTNLEVYTSRMGRRETRIERHENRSTFNLVSCLPVSSQTNKEVHNVLNHLHACLHENLVVLAENELDPNIWQDLLEPLQSVKVPQEILTSVYISRLYHSHNGRQERMWQENPLSPTLGPNAIDTPSTILFQWLFPHICFGSTSHNTIDLMVQSWRTNFR